MDTATTKGYDYDRIAPGLYALTQGELCRRSLAYFVKEFWDMVVPEQLKWSWHMDVICSEVQEIKERVFKRMAKKHDLIINVPPGMSKTQIVSVMGTCWSFAANPKHRIAVGSYSDAAVIGMADYIKLIMRSDKYKSYFPNTVVRADKNNIHNFKTTENGEFYAFTVGGTITSKHFDEIVIDDPLDPRRAYSTAETMKVNRFFTSTIPTRKTNKDVTPIVLVMQRLSMKDPTALLLSRGGVRHVCLPAKVSNIVSPPEYKEKYINGLLDPKRLSEDTIAELTRDMRSVAASAQLHQNPIPEEGNIIKRDYFNIIEMKEVPREALAQPVHFFFDGAYTAKTANDPSGMLSAFKYKNDVYLLNYWGDWLEFNPVYEKVVSTVNLYGDHRSQLLVEAKAIGETLLQEIRRRTQGLFNLRAYSPKGSKEDRLRAYAPKVENGNVFIINGKWADGFIHSICGFPALPHDEEVDTLTMCLDYFYNTNTKIHRRWKTGKMQ